MIIFKEKTYSEHEAMRSLYVELMRDDRMRRNVEIINKSQLIPVLKGNCIVIEKFVISTTFFGHDKYRMYLKIGAKAKLPDDVMLTGSYYRQENMGKFTFNINNGVKRPYDNNQNNNDQNNQQNFSDTGYVGEKLFKNNGGGDWMHGKLDLYGNLQMEVKKILGEAIKYDKKSRELILETDSIPDAIRALNILPFGIQYKVYLLE